MMAIQSPKKGARKPDGQPNSAERPVSSKNKKHKPPPPPFFAPKRPLGVPSPSAVPSSSPAFATPVHQLRPFQAPVPAKSAILPILLPPPTLRPLAFRTFTKKHSLTLTSSALQELAAFIGRHCGSGWREEGLAEKVLEEAARQWKSRGGSVIVDGASPELKDVLKTLEGNMSGGKIIAGPKGQLARQNSTMSLLHLGRDTESNAKTHLGLRPTNLVREDSQASFGMSGLDVEEEEAEDGPLRDPRSWLKVIGAFEQPRFNYSVAKRHFERDTSKPSLMPPASHKTAAFRNRFNVIHQRLMRSESFQSSAVADTRPSTLRRPGSSVLQQRHKITPIANLLGRHGSHHMLLGLLVTLPAGFLAISDLTGTIRLDISRAQVVPEDSAWFAPGMIVLADGVYAEGDDDAAGVVAGKGLSGGSGVGGTVDGRFQAFFLGQPPCEKRRVTLGVSGPDGGAEHMIGGGFGWIDFLGVGSERAVGSRMRRLEHRLLPQPPAVPAAEDPLEPEPEPARAGRGRVVILGEVVLTEDRTLRALRKILSLYASEPEGETPVAFVLVGNFTPHAVMATHPGGAGVPGVVGSVEYKEAFDGLAAALGDFPALLTSATFVMVPGDNDGWASAFGGGAAVPLPRRPVPDLFTSRVKRIFTTANAEAGFSSRGGGGGGKDRDKDEGHRPGGEVVWTTNPSRVSVFGPNHEIVLFRDDTHARLRRCAVRLRGTTKDDATGEGRGDGEDVTMSGANPGAGGDTNDQQQQERGGQDDGIEAMEVDDTGPRTLEQGKGSNKPAGAKAGAEADLPSSTRAARKLVKTLLDQGHLAPFRQGSRPVHWDWASVMHLYPLPTAAVLVDASAPPYCVTYEGCHVMNPSSVLARGRKAVARWVEYTIGGAGRVRECTF